MHSTVKGVGGGGAPMGLVHNVLMQFFPLGSSKMEVFESCFYDIVIIQYDHPRYIKHVLGRIYVFFTLFGYYPGEGGVSQKIGAQPAYAIFLTSAAQKTKFSKLIFLIL